MPDEPPCTSSVSPLFRPPRSNTLCQTVKKVSGSAAASVKVKPAGSGSALLSCTAAVFGIAAARRQRADPVADAPALHARADGRHLAGDLEAGQVGGAGRRRIGALALQHVGPVDAGGAHPDQDLALARPRHVALFGFQHHAARRARRSRPPSSWREVARRLGHACPSRRALPATGLLRPPDYVFCCGRSCKAGGATHGDLRRRTRRKPTPSRDRPGSVAAVGRRAHRAHRPLRAEIERLEAELQAKGATKTAAEALFRPRD